MLTLQDSDVHRAASHRHMIKHLTGPFSAGAVESEVTIDAAGLLAVTWSSREPLLLVAPAQTLAQTGLRVNAILDPDGAAESLHDLHFYGYAEVGAFLPLYRPEVDPNTRTAAPFEIALSLFEVDADGAEVAVPADQIATRLQPRIIEGVMGRMIYAMSAEKARIRGLARELAAMRLLDKARDDALDRFGAELGVARFDDEINYHPESGEVITSIRRDADDLPVPEPDDEYRRRLAIYRPFLPNRRHVSNLLNGPGEDGEPNAGLLAGLGLNERFQLLEDDNAFAFAIHLVETGPPSYRQHFLDYVRQVHLIHPSTDEPGETIHAERYIASERRDLVEALRDRLRANFLWPEDAALAPMLAAALDRVGRCRVALGVETPWRVERAQSNDDGSRYELGLGADLELLTAAELDDLATALEDPDRESGDDPEIEGLLQEMTPQSAAADPEGRWLLESCGMRTVHRLSGAGVYVSHLPTFGLTISGGNQATTAVNLPLEARYHAPGDPGPNAVLVTAKAVAAARWADAGHDPWTELSDPDTQDRLDNLEELDPEHPVLTAFQAADLPAHADQPNVAERLVKLPEELWDAIILDEDLAIGLADNEEEAVDRLRELLQTLREAGIVSALPLFTDSSEVMLVIGAIGLPQAGLNLSNRRATGFRWYRVPIQGRVGSIKALGSRTNFLSGGPGIVAVVVVGYARTGLTDPYEMRVELPDDATLDLKQYEFLMNLLDHIHPMGVEVNTFPLRKNHVDLDGDNQADPLNPSASRTYRRFRRPRQRGGYHFPGETDE